MINARAETLAEKPSYKQALLRRRCIVPSDGFYEWQQEGGQRQPVYIHRKDDALFGFAGLWDEWRQDDGAPLRTCTIITVGPNELMAPIHNRMPAILRPEDEALWLDPSTRDLNALLHVLQPYPATELEAYPVSRHVNSPAADDPSCLLPVS
jgi:putative SOS response-associated peptidase YedK